MSDKKRFQILVDLNREKEVELAHLQREVEEVREVNRNLKHANIRLLEDLRAMKGYQPQLLLEAA